MNEQRTTALTVSNLSYEIAGAQILNGVSFAIEVGEYVSIIGPNGAGKTTLIRCLNRILKPSSGDVFIGAENIRNLTQKQLARRVSYVPQIRSSQFPFTVREFVLLGRYPHLSPFSSVSRDDKDVVERMLELTGTTRFADRAVTSLSGGEFQKVSIAAALAQEADILLLDEPVTFLDPKYQNEVNQLLKRLNVEKNVTVVAVSHDINSAVLHSDQILALRSGEIAFHGTVTEMMEASVLEQIFDTAFLFVDHPKAGVPVVVPEEFVK